MNAPSLRRVDAPSRLCAACGHSPGDHDARFCPACGEAMRVADVIPMRGLVQLEPPPQRVTLARSSPTLLGVPRARPQQATAEVPRVGVQVARTRRSGRVQRPVAPGSPPAGDAPASPITAHEPDLDLSRARAQPVRGARVEDQLLDDEALLAASGLGRARRGRIAVALAVAAILLALALAVI